MNELAVDGIRELTVSEIEMVIGGLDWQTGENAILGFALAGLTIGTGGAGLFGLAVWAGVVTARTCGECEKIKTRSFMSQFAAATPEGVAVVLTFGFVF